MRVARKTLEQRQEEPSLEDCHPSSAEDTSPDFAWVRSHLPLSSVREIDRGCLASILGARMMFAQVTWVELESSLIAAEPYCSPFVESQPRDRAGLEETWDPWMALSEVQTQVGS